MKRSVQGGTHRKLLVVDDEERIRDLLAQYFSLKGYEVRVASGGGEALALTGAFHPDIVLLDVLMPEMSGVETLKALKQVNPAPKVLMLSVSDQEETAQNALSLGADFYVCKPPNLPQLERLVNGCCST